MSAHTPGPWDFGRFYYPEDGRQGTCEIGQPGELSILAKVVLPAKGRSAHGQGESNARLIAASPDMLSALHIASVALRDASAVAKATGFSVAETSATAAIMAVNAALNKAEGS